MAKTFLKHICKIILSVLVGFVLLSYLNIFSNENGSNHAYADQEATFHDSYFQDSSLFYNNDLAFLSAEMCDKAANSNSDNIISLLNTYGFSVSPYNYGDSAAFVIGHKWVEINNDRIPLILIIARGTQTIPELIGDWTKGGTDSFLGYDAYHNAYEFEEKIWTKLDEYVGAREELINADRLKVFVTGWSLGGAAANMVAARLDNCIRNKDWWSTKLDRADVFSYTFGAIKVLTVNNNVETGYENIHNIYNYYDSFGPHGNMSHFEASSEYAKFGHSEVYKKKLEEWGISWNNHDIAKSYKDALQNGLVTCIEKNRIANTDITVTPTAKAFTGKKIKPAPTVVLYGRTLKEHIDYTVSYKNNTNVGLATVTVKGISPFIGNKSKSFKINPNGTSIKSISKGSSSLTIKWNKQAKKMSKSRITGYQVEIATDKRFNNNKQTKTIKGYSKISKKITGLKSSTTYYVRVRTFKTINGIVFYSSWSGVKSVKTKAGFTYPEAGYRSLGNCTANYYEGESPAVPNYVVVGNRFAGTTETVIDSDFGGIYNTSLWYKTSASGNKQIVAKLKDEQYNDGEFVTYQVVHSVDLTDGNSFIYTRCAEDDTVDSFPQENYVYITSGNDADLLYSWHSDLNQDEDTWVEAYYDGRLIITDGFVIKAVNVMDHSVKTLLSDYIVAQSYGRYLLCEKGSDFGPCEYLNTRYLYDLKTNKVTKLPVGKNTVSYMTPIGIINYEYSANYKDKNKKDKLTKCDYKGKNKKTLLKGYGIEFIADTYALVYKGKQHYIYTYKTGKLKKKKVKLSF